MPWYNLFDMALIRRKSPYGGGNRVSGAYAEPEGVMNVYEIDKPKDRSWLFGVVTVATIALAAFVLIITAKSPTESTIDAKSIGNISEDGRCNVADCTLEVISLMRQGQGHECKFFCSEHLEWNAGPSLPEPENLSGNFVNHGVCKEQQVLSLTGTDNELIPRDDSKLPDFTSLMSKLKGKNILIIGDSANQQALDMLPMVLTDVQMEKKGYAYHINGGIGDVKDCGMDFKTKKMNCRFDSGDWFPCNCTNVFTYTVQDATFRFAHAYGMEYEDQGVMQIYGHPQDFNILRQVLYKHLVRSASDVVMNIGVIAIDSKPSIVAYAELMEFIKKESASMNKKFVYRLTMPQHFVTQYPPSTYIDDGKISGECLPDTTERHWTDIVAQKMLNNTNVDLLDWFPFSSPQGLFHSVQSGNCADWCFGYDLFYTFWDVLTTALTSLKQA